MKIVEKLTEMGIKQEDLTTLAESIEALIEERVSAKEMELKAHYEKVSEEFIATKLVEETDRITKELTEAKDSEMAELESSIVEKLDAFLETEISENISEEAIETAAVNEILKPVVEGIRKVFSESHLELDSEGTTLVKEAKEEIEKLTAANSALIEEKTELAVTAEKAAKALLIKESVEGLSKDQATNVTSLFEDKSFDETIEKIGSVVDMIIDEDTKAANGKTEKLVTEVSHGGDGLPEKKSEVKTASDLANELLSR
jgi:hypothetical protein